ncbi:MAG: type II secretion system protein [Thermodesulfobacteriota bacterium]
MTRCERHARGDAGPTEQGFTLLEVLAAVLILGLAYVATLESFSVAMRNIGKAETKRSLLLAEMVAFCQEVRFAGTEVFPAEEEEDGVLYLEGRKLRLLVVRSESGELMSLRLGPVL